MDTSEPKLSDRPFYPQPCLGSDLDLFERIKVILDVVEKDGCTCDLSVGHICESCYITSTLQMAKKELTKLREQLRWRNCMTEPPTSGGKYLTRYISPTGAMFVTQNFFLAKVAASGKSGWTFQPVKEWLPMPGVVNVEQRVPG